MTNTNRILLELCAGMRSFRDVATELTRTDLLIIAAIQNPEAAGKLLRAAAEGSQSAVCSVDAFGDKIRTLEQELQRH